MANVRLSCRQCQSRKRKCDKAVPCSSCREAGIDCSAVERKRLPRGRSGAVGKKNESLLLRLDRLEALLAGVTTAPTVDVRYVPKCREASDRLVAPEFWHTLNEEVLSDSS